MKWLLPRFIRFGQILLILALSLGGLLLVSQGTGNVRPAHALPEFADRTGESCGTCHVNPGGGGPRTLVGLLWSARGRPDQVPEFLGLLAAPAEITDGMELYDIACAGCHGYRGEGLFAMHLAETGVTKAAVRSFIGRGIPRSGMPPFADKFTEAQLDALVDFVTAVTTGQITLKDKYPLPPAQLGCIFAAQENVCGGQ